MHTAKQIEALIRKNVGVAGLFDFGVTGVGEGWAEIEIAYTERATRLGGTISGPVMMTAADTAMYAAVIQASDNGEFGVTSHMNIEFLRRPPPAALRVRGRVLRAGRRQVSCVVEIYSTADNNMVAHATGAYVLFDSATKADSRSAKKT